MLSTFSTILPSTILPMMLALLVAAASPAPAADAGTKASAPEHDAYVWRDGAVCNDLTFENVRTQPLVAAGRQEVRGTLEHRGSHTVRNVEVCGGGACTLIREGREMHSGDVAQFAFSIPTTVQTPITVHCSVRVPAGPS